jgi:hypothetical protein
MDESFAAEVGAGLFYDEGAAMTLEAEDDAKREGRCMCINSTPIHPRTHVHTLTTHTHHTPHTTHHTPGAAGGHGDSEEKEEMEEGEVKEEGSPRVTRSSSSNTNSPVTRSGGRGAGASRNKGGCFVLFRFAHSH